MRKIFYLKEWFDRVDRKIDNETFFNICYEYAKGLESEGWTDRMMEGGVISPDKSTIFIYDRIPYSGQLRCYNGEEEKFLEMSNKLIEKGDFTDKESYMLKKQKKQNRDAR